MKLRITAIRAGCVTFAVAFGAVLAIAQSDPLPSWNDTGPKQSILAFVAGLTKEGGGWWKRR